MVVKPHLHDLLAVKYVANWTNEFQVAGFNFTETPRCLT